jgi:hypothetical protein
MISLFLAMALISQGPDSVALQRAWTTGTQWKQEIVFEYVDPGQYAPWQRFTMVDTVTVDSKRAKELWLEHSRLLTEHWLEGTVLDLPAGQQPVRFREVLDKRLEQISLPKTVEPYAARLERLSWFLLPPGAIKVGSKWSRDLAVSEDGTVPATQLDFEVVEINSQTVKLRTSGKELGIGAHLSSSGWMRVDRRTTTILEGEWATPRFQPPNIPDPQKLTVRIKQLSFKGPA